MLAIAYYALARFGIAIAFVDPVASPIWPAAGVALGVVLLGGRRFLPAIFLGEFFALWAVGDWGTAAIGPAALSGLGNVAEAAVAMWAIEKWLGNEDILRRPMDVYPFAIAVCLLAAPIAASVGLLARVWATGGDVPDALRVWSTWWIGDCASMMVITPVFAAWSRPWTADDPDLRSAKFWLACGAIVGMFAIVFYTNTLPPSSNAVLTTALGYWSVGAFIWAIALLGRRGTATSYLALAAASILGIYHGRITGNQSAATALITSAAGLAVFHLAVLPIGILVEDRKRDRRTLESRVEERTRDLAAAMEELSAAKQAAEAAAQAKANFLATMSHEIRTPLNAVIGTAEMLEAGGVSADQRGSIDTIRTSSEHLLSVINDILDYSKAEAGQLQLVLAPVDLAATAAEAIVLGEPGIGRKPVRIRPDVAGAAVIRSDPHRIRQVLLNYLSNAIKFTAQGDIVVGAATRPRDDGLLDVHLWVRDSGIGIEPARQADLFKPFSQIAPAATRASGGTGLGLAIVKRILDALGGTVDVESAAGQGSTFHARFVAPPGQLVAAAPPVEGTRGKVHPLRILLAEDNATNRQVAVRMLGHLGQSATTANDGAEAVAAVLAQPFDLVLMDVHMPQVDGLEATRRIRAQETGRRTRIVAMTADALVEDRATCVAAGMDDYMSKPVRLADLERALREAAKAAP